MMDLFNVIFWFMVILMGCALIGSILFEISLKKMRRKK